ncbi:hypothetical protein [Capnocytophaga canis]|uniref:DUF6712 family protein n=1 Tax=Capnocytophaga canis TaxID=1848903 RepID=UPI0015626023|nr:hypothetical protein [Capnocytophaga canis]
MKLLINKQDIDKYFQISIHRKEAEVDRFVREAQLFDLKPKICDPFFVDLTDENASTDYSKLLDGGYYIYDNKNYYFEGLKACLCYFFHARYVVKSHQKDTATGLVMKDNSNSNAVSNSEKKDIQRLNQQDANRLWEDCLIFLQRNKENYPLFSQCEQDCKEYTPKSKLKFKLF